MNTDNQILLLVDSRDKFLGYASRGECHAGKGKRHRAFVTLLFDKENKVILQKRRHKLFDGLWDLTAVSHPLKTNGGQESYQQASDRALKKEMGISHVNVEKIGGFNYFAKDGSNCENEYCAVLIGSFDGEPKENHDEIYELKKMYIGDFLKDMLRNPSSYTPWALKSGSILKDYMASSN